jgi:hypothetical protein
VGPPDSPVVHRTVTVYCSVRLLAPALTLRVLSAHCSRTVHFCRRPLALLAIAPLGTPDSPVNYSGVASQIPEASKLELIHPGAPDTVRWCIGHCPMVHRTLSDRTPDSTVRQTRAAFSFLCSFHLNPFF